MHFKSIFTLISQHSCVFRYFSNKFQGHCKARKTFYGTFASILLLLLLLLVNFLILLTIDEKISRVGCTSLLSPLSSCASVDPFHFDLETSCQRADIWHHYFDFMWNFKSHKRRCLRKSYKCEIYSGFIVICCAWKWKICMLNKKMYKEM